MDSPVNQLPGNGSYHMHHNSEGHINEDGRIVLLRDLVSSFRACERAGSAVIEPEDCQMYRHILENAINYYKEERFRFFILQLENVRLEQVEKFQAEEQIRKNSEAEEQIRKLKDEIRRKTMKNVNLAVKLREAEHKVDHGADYVRNWMGSVLNESRSECSTETLEAAPEDEKARNEKL